MGSPAGMDLVLSGLEVQVSNTTGSAATQWTVYYKTGVPTGQASDWAV